jgi:hypothetical protein
MRTVRIVLGIFALLGAGLLAGGIYSFWRTRQFLRTAETAEGSVVQLSWQQSSGRHGPSWTAYPQIRFQTAEGRSILFFASVGSNPPSYAAGQPVKVLYDPQNPYHAEIDSFGQLWTLSIVFTGLGLFFSAPQAVLVVWQRASARKRDWLRQNGRRIQAELVHVGQNTSLTVNGAHPYRITCQWLDPGTNQMHVFHSGNFWYNPRQFLHAKTLEVLIDPANPHRYSLETSFLPKEV